LWSISTFKSWWTLAFSSRWKMTYRLIWTSMFRSWCICTVCFIMMMHSMYVVYSIVVRLVYVKCQQICVTRHIKILLLLFFCLLCLVI
jgi:hypothetical protein